MTVPISAAPVSARNPNDIFYQLENNKKWKRITEKLIFLQVIAL